MGPLWLGAIVLAPLYWLLVPAERRREAVILMSLAGLALHAPRLLALVLAATAGLFVLLRALGTAGALAVRLLAAGGLVALGGLFVWNKLGAGGMGPLPSQSGLLFVGVSYLVLKAAAALIDGARGALAPAGFGELLGWIAFLPTYPAGPMEDLDHFRTQHPTFVRARVLAGLERILFGAVKALLAAHYLGQWVDTVVAAPTAHGRGVLLLGLYALALRFYLDFAGYSDMAIGLGALFGYDIEENFDRPLIRRNLVRLWQHWHMTLTRWLRVYLFLPASRAVMRRAGGWGEHAGPALGQLVAMTFCGLWHGLAWRFALWGLVNGLGLVWVSIAARPLGRHLPPALVAWWRTSPIAYAASMALTVTFFSASLVLVVTDVPHALGYLRRVVGA